MWKRISTSLLSTAIAVAIIWFLLYRVWDDLSSVLNQIVPTWIVVITSIFIFELFVRGFRYSAILKRLDTSASTCFSTACIYVSQTANILLPARLGDFVRMFILKHEKGTPYTNSLTSLIAERVYDILTIAFLGLCTLPFLLSLIPKEYEWFIGLIIFVLICGCVGVLILVFTRRLHAGNKIISKVLEIFSQFRHVSSSITSFTELSVTSISIWLMDALICYMVSLMFGVALPFTLILLAIVIGNLVKAVPITPGGIGTYELALTVIFQIGGVPAATATMIAVVNHLINYGLTILGGGISIFYFGDWILSLLKRIVVHGKKIDGDNDEY